MKNAIRIIPVVVLTLVGMHMVHAQSTFSPSAYMDFLNRHVNYTTGEILSDYPARTTYYSERQYPTDLFSVPWYDSLNARYHFTADEAKLLEKNHFMVTERLESGSWSTAFIDIYSSDLPLFLSTDFILSTLHNSYDAILQTIEWQLLEPNLKELMHAMYNHFLLVAGSYAGDSRFDDVVKDVDLYISVALSLAEGATWAPQLDIPEKYNRVMEAVAAEQMVEMPLFTESRNRKLDFSQFTPRGHYVETQTMYGVIDLENYFRAMMWLGRIDFLVTAPPNNPWEPDWTGDELRRMQLGALITNEVLYGCGKLENLTKHEEIISFMVGPDDNLTPAELAGLSNDVITKPVDLFVKETFDDFMEHLNSSDDYGQKIMSNFFLVDPYSSDPGSLPVSFKLLGQKFLIDSYVFSEVVFDRIVFNGEKIWRPLPDPLDAMAALGSEDALALLEEEMDQYKYAANMAGLKYLIEAYDDNFWEQSLYNMWLGAIRNLNPPASNQGLPYFMKTTAWHQEKLNTQLTSWAQLRHDNILYGKQSYTGGTGCSYPYTFVEPYPEMYERIGLFAENARDFFDEVLPDQLSCKSRISSYYYEYAGIMGKLEEIAQNELDGTKFSEAEITFLKTMINEFMISGPSISGWFNDLFFDLGKGLSVDFTVADVHTQPTDFGGAVVGNVLHVGNGMINLGVFIAGNPCNPGQTMAFVGPVSSFHTEVTSGFRRLNDQEWEDYFRLGAGGYPARPDWVASYLVDGGGKMYPEGRALKGTIYTGVSEQHEEPQLVDYLLLFPNPASDEIHVRFVLNRPADYSMEVFDLTGRKFYRECEQLLFPAEHDFTVPVTSLSSGMYVVKINIGNRSITKPLVIK
jgi:hypothetical protein